MMEKNSPYLSLHHRHRASKKSKSLLRSANGSTGSTHSRSISTENISESFSSSTVHAAREGWEQVYALFYEGSSLYGHRMRIFLMAMISMSCFCAILDSIHEVRMVAEMVLFRFEIFFTFFFMVEFILRLSCMSQPFLYIKSFSGMIDLITMFTSLIAICFPSSGRDLFGLLILRIFRILRVFRIFRLAFFFQVTSTLGEHLETNKHGITALFSSIFCTIFFIGSAMYLIEGERSGFSNIPITLYWTFMTFTTVGLNDPSPSTVPGKIMAIVVVLAGYGIIALAAPVFLTTMPSSMVSSQRGRMESPCSKCFEISHERDARFCRYCGTCLHRNRNLMTGRRLRLTTTTKTRGRTMSGEDLTTVMSPTEAQKTEFVANHYYEDQNMTKCSISEESLRAATNASDHFV